MIRSAAVGWLVSFSLSLDASSSSSSSSAPLSPPSSTYRSADRQPCFCLFRRSWRGTVWSAGAARKRTWSVLFLVGAYSTVEKTVDRCYGYVIGNRRRHALTCEGKRNVLIIALHMINLGLGWSSAQHMSYANVASITNPVEWGCMTRNQYDVPVL